MVQNLNNNLITAPELADLRKRLRNLETKARKACTQLDTTLTTCRKVKHSLLRSLGRGATMPLRRFLSVSLLRHMSKLTTCFRSCRFHRTHGKPQANTRSAELEMTINMLIQIDKLVQLLESPVFTCKDHAVHHGPS